MKTRDFSFELPEELIAQRPADRRDDARLLVLERESGERHHTQVSELPSYLPPESLLVLNDTRVRKARFEARRPDTGGTTEFLLLERLDERRFWAITNRARRTKIGRTFTFPGRRKAEVIRQQAERRLLEFSEPVDESYIEQYGSVPLPPYIRRSDDALDAERYQTVYARTLGSVAAPTAGLHFTEELLERLQKRGIEVHFLTLHVGLGTFWPVRAENVEDHEMHAEQFEIPPTTAEAVNEAKRAGRPVVAVGTTSIRALESAARERDDGVLTPGVRDTDIFIYPGFRFRVADALFTNFHTPESTLLMLVSAFAGRERILNAYREAVTRGYRFYSYGDAMLIR
ncbi:MAG: tRNA preQ1(34) S-adenosylmethionine ribosyltransferase-isomerase QueA [Spirochaetaceae bacterium]